MTPSIEGLVQQGVTAVAITQVDNAGVARVKAVPVARLPQVAETGVGFSPVIDAFGIDDSIASFGSPVGDLRMVPDLDALAPLAAQPGWAWAPGDKRLIDGRPYPACQRTFARRMVEQAADHGLELRAAFETEWVVDAGTGDELVAPSTGLGYGMGRLVDLSAYARDVLAACATEGIDVAQLHPEYAPGQMELSVGVLDPVAAADRVVLVRHTLRGVSANHGYRCSLSPALTHDGVGNGAHLHLSVWGGGESLMARPGGVFGPAGGAWLAGILTHLPGLLAIGAPSVASYLRLQPHRWAAPWQVWGPENREAALRFVDGASEDEANLEIKAFDASANPYLVVGAVIAAGLDGIEHSAKLPPPVTVDPASLSDDERAGAGIRRLPTTLADALDAFEADQVLTGAMGPQLAERWLANRRAEVGRFADADPAEIATASRWVW